MTAPALIVIAKAPVAGRSKTRLSPPCTPAQAAALAEAALTDTLGAASGADCGRRVVVLDGEPGEWLPPGFEVLPQIAGGFDLRLGAAFEAVGGPALLIGMDTPQVDAGLLDRSVAELMHDGQDAVFGAAVDGGWWALGLRHADASLLRGLPMSTPWTARAQRERLTERGVKFAELPVLRDVDTITDAIAVAAECPGSRFASTLESMALPVRAVAEQGA